MAKKQTKRIYKNLQKTFAGYKKLKLSELSAVRLQPSMDKKWKR